MRIKNYDVKNAVKYARTYALSRNPTYYNFDLLGGDCTNFVSQCVFAGTKIMNYTPLFGWYYRSLRDRTPAWSGVDEFYSFITKNSGAGPFGRLVNEENISIGDVIQLANFRGEYYHALFVTDVTQSNIYVCSHTRDGLDTPLSNYNYAEKRCIHIEGAREF